MIDRKPDGPPRYANFNVRVYDELPACKAWCAAQGIPHEVFVNFDGGGFNHYILEFRHLEDALAFMAHFRINCRRPLWAEDEQGGIHYLRKDGTEPERDGDRS